MDQRFSVRCNVKGRRLPDTDGLCIKAILDAITACGIWPDDSPKYVKEVSYAQEIGSAGDPDETIIIVEEIPSFKVIQGVSR